GAPGRQEPARRHPSGVPAALPPDHDDHHGGAVRRAAARPRRRRRVRAAPPARRRDRRRPAGVAGAHALHDAGDLSLPRAAQPVADRRPPRDAPAAAARRRGADRGRVGNLSRFRLHDRRCGLPFAVHAPTEKFSGKIQSIYNGKCTPITMQGFARASEKPPAQETMANNGKNNVQSNWNCRKSGWVLTSVWMPEHALSEILARLQIQAIYRESTGNRIFTFLPRG